MNALYDGVRGLDMRRHRCRAKFVGASAKREAASLQNQSSSNKVVAPFLEPA
jgi:hypothetical protein